jgi:hypothetical protein
VGISQRQKERTTLEEGLIMGTWVLPGGDRITGVPDVPADFTPTAEEWFWSAIFPPNFLQMYSDKSGETTMYFGLNVTASTVAMWYSAGESLSTLRMMKMAQSTYTMAQYMPYIAVAAAGTAAGAYVGYQMVEPVASAMFNEAAYAAGADVSPSSTKPWFIPLPIWIAMH